MPTRKLEALLRRQSTVDEREIIALRNEYLLQLGKLAARDAAAPLIDKARELLKSRYWANSSWKDRGKILATVDFLLRTHNARDETIRKKYS